jgi:hypothetical protein
VLVKIGVAATAMGAVAAVIDRQFGVPAIHGLAAQTVNVALSIGGALVVLVATAKFLGLSEFDEVAALVRSRVRKLLGS